MATIESIITENMISVLIVLLVSSIPLYIGIRYLGGETGIVKSMSISILLSFILIGAIKFIGLFAGIFVLIASLFIYQLAFKVSIVKALAAWSLQYLFAFLVIMLIIVLTP